MRTCYKCEKEFTEKEEEEECIVTCDKCEFDFHLRCAKTKKEEVAIRKDSKCLKIFCPTCLVDTSDFIERKLIETTKLLYKIDLFNQERKPDLTIDSANIKSIVKKVNSIEAKIETNTKSNISNVNIQNNNGKKSYANVVKPAQPTVVIKPKKKQNSKETFEEITKTVDKSELNVTKIRNARNTRDGGIVLRCNDVSETMKVRQAVNKQMSEKYDVILPEVKQPRIRITNIDIEIANEEIVNELKKYNQEIHDVDMKLITTINRKFRSYESKDAVFEVNGADYDRLIQMQILALPWRECKIVDHVYLKRCFKCCGFSHISKECKHQKQTCSKCAGSHKFSECKAQKLCCTNCKEANAKFKLNVDTKHHAWSKDCAVLQRRFRVLKNTIEYKPTE